jgi:hypothetical protein
VAYVVVNDTPSYRGFGTTLFATRLESNCLPDTVLVAFDGSPLSERAVTYAVETFLDATITTLYVIDPVDSAIDVEAGGLPIAEYWYESGCARVSAA